MVEVKDRTETGGSLVDWWSMDYSDEDEWLIPGLLARGEAGYVHATRSSYKSFFLMQLCLELSAAVPLFGGTWDPPPTQIPTLLLQGEGRAKGWWRRLRDASQTLQRDIPFYTYHVQGQKLDRPVGTKLVLKLLERHRPSLLVIDPLRFLFEGDDSNPDAVSRWIDLFNSWRQMYECAVLVAHHNRKPQQFYADGDWRVVEGGINESRGRTELPDWADLVLGFQKSKGKKEKSVKIVTEKVRDSEDDSEFRFRFDYPLLYPEGGGDRAQRAVQAALHSGAVSQSDVLKKAMEDSQRSERSIYRAIDELIEAGVIKKEDTGGRSPIIKIVEALP